VRVRSESILDNSFTLYERKLYKNILDWFLSDIPLVLRRNEQEYALSLCKRACSLFSSEYRRLTILQRELTLAAPLTLKSNPPQLRFSPMRNRMFRVIKPDQTGMIPITEYIELHTAEIGFCLQRLQLLPRIAAAYGAILEGEQAQEGLRVMFELTVAIQTSPVDYRIEYSLLSSLHRMLSSMTATKSSLQVEEEDLRFFAERRNAPHNILVRAAAWHLLLFLQPSKTFSDLCSVWNILQEEDFFLRAALIENIEISTVSLEEKHQFLLQHAQDSSEFVRQHIIQSLGRFPLQMVSNSLRELLPNEPARSVRLQLYKTMSTRHLEPQEIQEATELYTALLKLEQDPFCLDLLLGEIIKFIEKYMPPRSDQLSEAVSLIVNNAETSLVRTRAIALCEILSLCSSPETISLVRYLSDTLSHVKIGHTVKLNFANIPTSNFQLVLRVLKVFAVADVGYEVRVNRRHIWIQRGDRWQRRFWRFLYEIANPAPDKRQGISHLRSRSFNGSIRIPSFTCAEVTQARVPGEPVLYSEQEGWLPYLPLPEDLRATLQSRILSPFRPYLRSISTAEGRTILVAPSWLRAISGYLRVTVLFNHLADLRLRANEDPRPFLTALSRLGFRIRYLPSKWNKAEVARERKRLFNPARTQLASLWLSTVLLNQYFGIFHLALVTILLFAIFVLNHVYRTKQLRRARRAIPLVVGGWGSRGKSGTERLKAALFNSLGVGVVSKSTGCEANLVIARPFGPLVELLLFRPAGKATIWEQHQVALTAARLRTQVFLWECMALNPEYVDILQAGWMRDDISTITNAYPDHEDIQGPSGVDVARVIARFIPRQSRVLTTEREMLPYLREEAVVKRSLLSTVDSLESALIPAEVIRRFPYQEHPKNIALVVQLASLFQMQPWIALKEMSERVIPDLGVLQTFGPLSYKDRSIEFINGMSANERAGCLSNWNSTGFAQIIEKNLPEHCLVTIVNNRDDRISRSQMFARILVQDLRAEFHFLVGTNLGPFRKMILDEAAHYINERFSAIPIASECAEIFNDLCLHFRLPIIDSFRKARHDLIKNDESSRNGLLSIEDTYKEKFLDIMSSFHEGKNISEQAAKFILDFFEQKIIVIEECAQDLDRLFDAIYECTPPGVQVRAMAIQNIKGPGILLVNEWRILDEIFTIKHSWSKNDRQATVQRLISLAPRSRWGQSLRQELLAQSTGVSEQLSFTPDKVRGRTTRTSLVNFKDHIRKSGFFYPFRLILDRWRADYLFDRLVKYKDGLYEIREEFRELSD
jgi:gamma-polyglutamate synthase